MRRAARERTAAPNGLSAGTRWRVLACLAPLALAVPAVAAAAVAWPEALYNPRPLAGDVRLPLPCGGAMAFRRVAADGAVPPGSDPALAELYRLRGPFGEGRERYLLIGKYEVTELQ